MEAGHARSFSVAVDLSIQVEGNKEPSPQSPSPSHTPLGAAEDLIRIQTLSVISHSKVPSPWNHTNPQRSPHSFTGPILPATEAPYYGLPVASSPGPGVKGVGLGGAGNPL